MPNIQQDGVAGYNVGAIHEAVLAVKLALARGRAQVRAAFENRFTLDRMAEDDVAIYRTIIGHAQAGAIAALPRPRAGESAPA